MAVRNAHVGVRNVPRSCLVNAMALYTQSKLPFTHNCPGGSYIQMDKINLHQFVAASVQTEADKYELSS